MSTPDVYTAINRVQAKLATGGIGKDRKNQQQGFTFRGIDDIYNALARVLADESLCILPRVLSRSVTERETKSGGMLYYVACEVEFDFVSSKDGSKHTLKMYGEAMDSGDKATNKAMSAAYKYVCLQAFCIPTEGDNDADATTHADVIPVKLPAAWDRWTINEKGENRAYAGTKALSHWWEQLTVDEKKMLKPILDKEWKAIAAQADGAVAK